MTSTGPATGRRVQRLRVAKGLSQADLAQATGLATGIVSMVENGRHVVDIEMADALAHVFDCLPSYFSGGNADEPLSTRPWLRAYADASKRAVDRYIADAELAVQEIESLRLKTIPETLPTFNADPNNEHAVEEFAEVVRQAAHISDGDVVSNAIRAAERLGCVVLPMDDELGRHFGMSLRINGIPVIRVSRPRIDESGLVTPPGDRQRFTLAHELGHLTLHAAMPPPGSSEESSRVERQAHRFAGAFLAPADALLEDLHLLGGRVTLSTLQQLKQRWGVAIKMLVSRMRQLEQIDDYQARSLYKQISARKWNKVEPVPVGHERAIWLEKALARSSTHRSILRAQAQALRTGSDVEGRSDLATSYFDDWVDWSVRRNVVEPADADVIQLATRRASPNNHIPAQRPRNGKEVSTMTNANYSVFKDGDDWVAKRDGASRASSRSHTQSEAYEDAKRFSGNDGGGEVSIHNVQGQIREKNTISPAKDPRESKG